MLKDFFKKPKYVTVTPSQNVQSTKDTVGAPLNRPTAEAPAAKRDIPEGLWSKCQSCGDIFYTKELVRNQKVCLKCGYHFRLSARERIEYTVDENSFRELDADLGSANPLDFPGYPEKVAAAGEASGLKEAVLTGEAAIEGFPVVIAAMDSNFIMASMGSVVGEKITRAMERALELRIPMIAFTASGGARMQEGIISLMQMAKTAGTVSKLNEAGVLYITVFTDPTTGGVTASFASVADISLAEPGALIGFAGRRVIEQNIRQKLPDDFQKAEFMLKHGFMDQVVSRNEMRATLAAILELHQPAEEQHAH
ncbi:MAG TPA: acetyl-CoA carboxylase, carboxyltransferase subunit beta [Bacillota bacterium]|nr:acetyl-CoA carboxylase, carboxyltransferase subunit beta [Bacillota bacterium]